MINNFESVRDFIKQNENYFYSVCLWMRSKDIGFRQNSDYVRQYIVKNWDELMDIRDELITLSEAYEARIYIRIDKCSEKMYFKRLISDLSRYTFRGTSYTPNQIISSAITNYTPFNEFVFLDIDAKEYTGVVKQTLINIYSEQLNKPVEEILNNIKDYIYLEIPTPHGCHIVARPYVYDKKHYFPATTIINHMRYVGVLLYYPDSLDKKTE